jgi:iron(III) transport system ATP-binding protein
MSSAAGVRLSKVTKEFVAADGKKMKAVDSISLDIAPGEFVTLLGPSGCGKTTTLRMVAGFETPTEGGIFLGDEDIVGFPPEKRDTAMVFQSYALFPHYNVFDNIAYGLKIRKLPSATIKEKVKAIIALVGLSGLEARSPGQLSGGQQQRVALARALVMEPKVLLFDEPLSNLDAKLRVYMRTEIRKIQKKVGITAIYVTHDQSEAMSLSDRVIIMRGGVIEQVGTPADVYYRPSSEFVADFIGLANFIDGKIAANRNGAAEVSVQDRIVSVPYSGMKQAGAACRFVVRPEAVQVAERGIFPCKVLFSTFMGAYQDYVVELAGSALKVHDFNPRNRRVFNEGETAFLNIDLENAHLL